LNYELIELQTGLYVEPAHLAKRLWQTGTYGKPAYGKTTSFGILAFPLIYKLSGYHLQHANKLV